MFELVLQAGQLTLLFVIPGSLLILIIWGRFSDLAETLLYGFAISTSLVIALSATLLLAGVFSILALLLAVGSLIIGLVIAGTALRRFNRASARNLISRESLSRSLGPLFVAVLVLAIGLLTPHWNFLLGSNMDAGNYEIYGNHFVRTGSFLLESSALVESGVPPEFVESGNSWNVVPGTNEAKPSFFPGFSILLAVFKGIFNTPLASTFAPIALAAASAGLLARAASHIVRRAFVGTLIVVAAVLTPLFFFYSKQIMAEAVALLGVSLIVDTLLRYRSWAPAKVGLFGTGIGIGLFLALTAKLDAYVLLALVPIGLLLALFEARPEQPTPSGHPVFSILPLAGVVSGSVLVASMVDPGYASKLVPGRLSQYISPPLAIIAYGVTFGALMVGVWLSPRWKSRWLGDRDQTQPGAISPWRHRLAAAHWALAGAWAVFLLWNLVYRPRTPFEIDHNPHNLPRLFDVVDPTIMTVFLLCSIVVLLWPGPDRPVLIMLIIGLGILIVASRHNRSELWWMRRYLFYLIPAVSIGIAGGLTRIFDRAAGQRGREASILALAVAVLLGVSGIRVVDMDPLFQLEYNSDIPTELEELSAMLQPGDFVVIPQGNPSVRALVNTKRSLDGQPMFGPVPPDRIYDAIETAEGFGTRVVLALESPEHGLDPVIQGRFELIGSGTVTQPGVRYLAHVRNNPTRATVVPYQLYATAS